MEQFVISSDSTCDLYADYVRENDIRILSMSYTIEKNGVDAAIKEKPEITLVYCCAGRREKKSNVVKYWQRPARLRRTQTLRQNATF